MRTSPHEDKGDSHDESEESAAERVAHGLGGETGDGTRGRRRVGRDSMGPGGYRFTDYLKLSVPLTFVVPLAVALLLPIFWPLYPAR